MTAIENYKNLNKSVYIHDSTGKFVIRELALDFLATHRNCTINTGKYDEVNTSVDICGQKQNSNDWETFNVYIRPHLYDQRIRTGATTYTYVKTYTGEEIEAFGPNTNYYSVTVSYDEEVQ